MLKIVVNCGPAERYISRCLASLRAQSFTDWEAYVTIDPWGDRSHHEALVAREDDARIHVRRNPVRRYTMANLISAIDRSEAAPDDVIAILDGDDWLATTDALAIIDDAYRRSGCWMTYGSWVTDIPIPAMAGQWPAYPDGLTDFRNHEWLGTAIRTWKRWLWDLVDDRDFRDAEGRYFRVTEDQASMLPMLEMSGVSRARHIGEVLMIYNRSTPHACATTRRNEMLANCDYIRALPPYARLAARPDSKLAIRTLRAGRKEALLAV
jgi:glycosyltransferase involved in cell wall biosynthesis